MNEKSRARTIIKDNLDKIITLSRKRWDKNSSTKCNFSDLEKELIDILETTRTKIESYLNDYKIKNSSILKGIEEIREKATLYIENELLVDDNDRIDCIKKEAKKIRNSL